MRLKLKYNPSGVSCKHVHILDAQNKVLTVTTEDELVEPIKEREDVLLSRVKNAVAASNLKPKDLKEVEIEDI